MSDVGYKRPPVEHQIQPGQSGNPKGKPKGCLSLTNRLQKLLNENPEAAEKAIAAHIEKASNGDVTALKLLYDRMDGLQGQTIKFENGELVSAIVRVLRQHVGQTLTDELIDGLADLV